VNSRAVVVVVVVVAVAVVAVVKIMVGGIVENKGRKKKAIFKFHFYF